MLELNKIYHADCYEAIKQIDDKSIDLVCTDPPYKLGYHFDASRNRLRQMSDNRRRQMSKITDGIDEDIYEEFIRVCKKVNIIMFCSKMQIPSILNYFVTQRNYYFDILSWHKTNHMPFCNGVWAHDTEYIIHIREKGVDVHGTAKEKSTYFISGINNTDGRIYDHPTIKPLNIVKRLVLNTTYEGGVVLDPFMGSGTTAIAAAQTARRYIGFEKDDEYYKVCTQRIKDTLAQAHCSL